MDTKDMTTKEALETVLDAAAIIATLQLGNHKALIKAIDIVEDYKNDLVRRDD